MHTLKINGTDLSTYGIFLGSETYLDAPLIDYTAYDIPAKNGSVIQYNKRLNNVIRKFDCYIPESQNVATAMDSLKKLLYSNIGYMKLESSYDTDTYQEGYLAQEISVAPFNIGQSATFSLYFSCKPQKWYKSLATTTTTTGTSYSSGRGIYSYTNPFIQKALQGVPQSMIPDVDQYIVFQFASGTGTTFGTYPSGTFSTGQVSILDNVTKQFAIVVSSSERFPQEEADLLEVIGYSSIFPYSFVGETLTTTSYLLCIVPYQENNGHFVATATISGTSGMTSLYFNQIQKMNDATAVGNSLEVTVDYYVNDISAAFGTYSVVVVPCLNSAAQSHTELFTDFNLMEQDILDIISADYLQVDGSRNFVQVVYDLTLNTAMLKNGTKTFDISEYCAINGIYAVTGDEIHFETYLENYTTGTPYYNGFVKKVTPSTRWWKL